MLKPTFKYDINLVLKANNLIIHCEKKVLLSNMEIKKNFSNFWKNYGDKELIGRNHILKSFCPQVNTI